MKPETTSPNGHAHDQSTCPHQTVIDQLRHHLGQVLRGKDEVIENVLLTLLARGHLLLEDMPGLGKTTLAKAVAQAIGGRFSRIQGTPDLLPSDITGFAIFNQKTRDFEFLPGPVFADVLLADEINRATPRTQSALFEAMAERQVTVDAVCHSLSSSFFVIATQNPVETHGVYPLPEAQLDRFTMKLSIGYPSRLSEMEMLADDLSTPDAEASKDEAVVDLLELQRLQRHVARVSVCDAVRGYLVDWASATRQHPEVKLGVSPRGIKIWQRVAQARAHLAGREYVTPDDVQDVAEPVLSVRLGGETNLVRDIIAETMQQVPVPE